MYNYFGLLLVLYLFGQSSYCQNHSADSLYITTIIETTPEPKKGIAEIYRWFSENLDLNGFAQMDTLCRKRPNRIIVKFLIDEEGRLIRPEIERGVGDPYDQYLLTLLSEMPVEWTPATYGGKPIKGRKFYPFSICIPYKN